MALPELLLPPSITCFLAQGHAIEIQPAFVDTVMRTGHSLRRRIYTTAPRLVTVGLLLENEQMADFHAWFEGPLQVGALSFAARVKNQGPGMLYWEARFEGPYRAEAINLGYPRLAWRVTARLRLDGEGSATPPTPSTLLADSFIALIGAANITIPQTLTADSVIALVAVGPSMAADTIVILDSIINGAPASDVDQDVRWSWMRYPYARGRSADLADIEAIRRNWMGF